MGKNKRGNTDVVVGRRVRAEIEQRRQRLLKKYIDGCRHFHELAASEGVSRATVHKDLKVAFGWLRGEHDPAEEMKQIRDVAVAQLMEDRYKASVEFERSKQSRVEITTTYGTRKCPDCDPPGFAKDGTWCKTCNGEGELMTETEVRKVTGQCGDPQYLRVMTFCASEVAKIQGAYRKDDRDKEDRHLHLHQHNLLIDLSDATDEQITDLRAAMEPFRQRAIERGNGVGLEEDTA